jgi:LEA14-like dessication related protein
MRTGLQIRSIASTVLVASMILVTSCLPKQVVELKDIQNLRVAPGPNGFPILQGDAVFFNPNKSRMKLKAIKVEVFVDEKKAAVADHELDVLVKGKSEFTVPLKVELQMKDFGLADALKSLLGGKTYKLHYLGSLRVNVNGFPARVPIDHHEDFKLKF